MAQAITSRRSLGHCLLRCSLPVFLHPLVKETLPATNSHKPFLDRGAGTQDSSVHISFLSAKIWKMVSSLGSGDHLAFPYSEPLSKHQILGLAVGSKQEKPATLEHREPWIPHRACLRGWPSWSGSRHHCGTNDPEEHTNRETEH